MLGEKEIIIKFVNSEDQRYSTCGDYLETPTHHEFRITKQTSPEKSMLILFHEMVEYYLTELKGIPEETITNFDLCWNSESINIEDEPGNCKSLHGIVNPYYKEHRFAENIERQIAHEAGIDWFDYESNLII